MQISLLRCLPHPTKFIALLITFAILSGSIDWRAAIRLSEPLLPPPPPPVVIRIDVGNTSSYKDSAGRVWSPDAGLFTPASAVAERRGSPAIANADDPTIYQTYRGNVGGKTPQSERAVTFNIPIPASPPQKVNLRLHFAELYWGTPGGGPAGPGKRIFSVTAEGKTVLTDYDITAAGGAALTAVVVPINDIQVSDGSLTLTFTPKTDFAAISAIEMQHGSFHQGPP